MKPTNQRKRKPQELHEALMSQDMKRTLVTMGKLPHLTYAIGATFGNLTMLRSEPWGRSATPLHAAINIDERQVLKHLIEEGVDVNSGRVNGGPPLAFSLYLQRYEITRMLLHAGADVNHIDERGKVPMYYAIQNKSPASIVEDLLAAGFPKDGIVCKVEKSRPLTRAIHMQNVPVVKYLLQQSVDVNSYTVEWTTPLKIAILSSNWEITKLLVKHGAKVEGLGGRDEPPLYLVTVIKGPTPVDVIECLVKAGADINRVFDTRKYVLNKLPFDFVTVLQIAVTCNKLEAVKAILENGADVNLQTPEQQGTALHVASIMKIETLNKEEKKIYRQILQLLFDHGADVNGEDCEGLLPVHGMCSSNNWIAVEECVRAGLSVNTTIDEETDTMTLFHLILNEKMNLSKLVELCFDFGADCTIPCLGVLPYHYAFGVGHPATIKLFLKYGHPFNDFPIGGKYCVKLCKATELMENQVKLFEGIKSNNARYVREALVNGAEARSTSMEMKYPLHYAADKGFTEIVRLLLEHGAAPSTLDYAGRCALHLAGQKGDSATCTVLLRHGACYNYRARSSPGAVPVLDAVHRHFTMVRRGDAAVVEELSNTLGSDQFWAYINCVNRRGDTLAGEALRRGHGHMAEAIMDLRLRAN